MKLYRFYALNEPNNSKNNWYVKMNISIETKIQCIQRFQSDATAKRLNYGDYVRTSTKEGSLQNPVKPSPWSDFMDLKKGNIYSLSREEKV